VYDGAWSVEHCREMWDAGRFDYQGRRPIAQAISDCGSGKGSTFYVGSSASSRMLRCYEKGKQLGDPNSAWVRWEVQLRVAGGRIPFDVMTSPGAAIRGAFAALEFVSETATRAHHAKQRVKSSAASAMRWLKKQYGGTLAWLKNKTGGAAAFAAAFDAITRDTLPPWAKEPLFHDEWPALLAEALGLKHPGEFPA
jgi:DNA relaxase NicK